MKKRFLLFVLFHIGILHWAISQSQPTYGDYYFDPAVYNPSFTGSDRMLEVSLIHKNQWVGIEGAPVNSTLHVQIPTETKMSVGIDLISDKSVVLRTTSFYSSFAYMVPLGKNHYFQFGLSGGLALEGMTTENVNTQDPAVMQAAQSKVQWLGQAGIHYRKDQLVLGFCVPSYQFTVPQSEQVTEDKQYFKWTHRFSMLMVTAQYRLTLVPAKVDLEPVFIYRFIAQTDNQLQISSIIHFQNILWVGASYRQENGMAFLTGIKIKKKYKIGYQYGMAPGLAGSYSYGSHEIQLSISTGKVKKIRH